MALWQPRIQYVTGSVGVGAKSGQPPRAGSVNFLLYNRGNKQEHARVEVVKWTSFPLTEIVWKSDDASSLINPEEAQLFEYLSGAFDGTRYWGRIYVTSENLVPSVEFVVDDPDLVRGDDTVIGYYAPGDFAKFVLPRNMAGGVEAPIGGAKTS